MIALPFLLQGFAMFFDEFYFHHRRRLPRWERIGHPLDTLSVLICYGLLLFLKPGLASERIILSAMGFSCLLITKDEFVHTQQCTAFENWLHAILFILHPIVFYCAYLIWQEQNQIGLLYLQTALIVTFMFYQIFYWSFYANDQ